MLATRGWMTWGCGASPWWARICRLARQASRKTAPRCTTLWGELAWQLGGREAYNIVAGADRSGTNPGEALHTLISAHGPVLILIDEWVAYARQLVTDKEHARGLV